MFSSLFYFYEIFTDFDVPTEDGCYASVSARVTRSSLHCLLFSDSYTIACVQYALIVGSCVWKQSHDAFCVYTNYNLYDTIEAQQDSGSLGGGYGNHYSEAQTISLNMHSDDRCNI